MSNPFSHGKFPDPEDFFEEHKDGLKQLYKAIRKIKSPRVKAPIISLSTSDLPELLHMGRDCGKDWDDPSLTEAESSLFNLDLPSTSDLEIPTDEVAKIKKALQGMETTLSAPNANAWVNETMAIHIRIWVLLRSVRDAGGPAPLPRSILSTDPVLDMMRQVLTTGSQSPYAFVCTLYMIRGFLSPVLGKGWRESVSYIDMEKVLTVTQEPSTSNEDESSEGTNS